MAKLPAGAEHNVVTYRQVLEDAGPGPCLVVVNYSPLQGAGVHHFQDVFIFQEFRHIPDFDFLLSLLAKPPVEFIEAGSIAAGRPHI